MKKYINQYLTPVLISLFVFGIPMWDKLNPMKGSEQIIEQQFGYQFSWCVAFSGFSNSKESASSRMYILLPGVLSNGAIATVTSVSGNYPTVSTINYGALFALFAYANMFYAYFRSRKKQAMNSVYDSTNKGPVT